MAQRGWAPLGGSTGSGSLYSHMSPTSSRARGGARWALPSASVSNDLWPTSEVREGLEEGVSQGLDSWAECLGPQCAPQSPASSWVEELSSSSLWTQKEIVI